MPYINKQARIELFDGRTPQTAGELNYQFTLLALQYLESKGRNYQTMNDIVGALDNAKDEFRRRIQHPYENEKIVQNSDVYNGVGAG